MKIDIISGFLGAGKTTLIKKILEEEAPGKKIALIENELGEVGLDGQLLKRRNLQVKDIYSGCICCTLKGNLNKSIQDIQQTFHPDRILVEPSGVARLSAILQDLKEGGRGDALNLVVTVVDPLKFPLYKKNFPDFYGDQIENAATIILSRTQQLERETIQEVTAGLKCMNKKAVIITSPWAKMKTREIKKQALPQKSWPDLLPSPRPPFQIWGMRTGEMYSCSALKEILKALDNKKALGVIIRGKGILKGEKNHYLLNYSGGEKTISSLNKANVTGVCIIGQNLNQEALTALFKKGHGP